MQSLKSWRAEMTDLTRRERRRRKALAQFDRFTSPHQVGKRVKLLRRAFPNLAPGVIYPLATSYQGISNPLAHRLAEMDAKVKARGGSFANTGELTDGRAQARAAVARRRSDPARQFDRQLSQSFDADIVRGSGPDLGDMALSGLDELTDTIPVVGSVKALAEGNIMEAGLRGLPGYAASQKVFDLERRGAEGLEELGVPLGREVATGLRGLSRATQLGMQVPTDVVLAGIRRFADTVSDFSDVITGEKDIRYALTREASRQDPLGLAPETHGRHSPPPLWEQSQGLQALDDALHDRPIDVGAGWFPDPHSETGIAAAEAAREAAPTINGHAFTLGRFVANQVFTPDTVPFDLLSGAVDASVTVYADPLNPAFTAYTQLVRNRRLVDISRATEADVLASKASATFDDATDAATRLANQRLRARRELDYMHSIQNPSFDDLKRLERAESNYLKVTERAGLAADRAEAAKATRAELLNEATEAAGGHNGHWRPWVNRKTVTEWFASNQGRAVLNYHLDNATRYQDELAKASDPSLTRRQRESALSAARKVADDAAYDSWLRYGKKGDVEFHRGLVTDVHNLDDLHGKFDDVLGTTMREFPQEKKFTPNWTPKLDGYRWSAQTPSEPGLFLDAKNLSAEQADRWMRNANMPREARAEVFGRIAAAETNDDWFDAAQRMTQMVEDQLVDVYGISRRKARQVTRLFGPETERDFVRFGYDSVTGKNLDQPFAKIGPDGVVQPSPHLLVEQLTTGIPLPDYKEIRRITKSYGGKAERWYEVADSEMRIYNDLKRQAHELGAGTPERKALLDEAVQHRKNAARAKWAAGGKDTFDGVVGGTLHGGLTIWVKAHLFRPAWGVRVVAEEQARMWAYGLNGVFDHPITALSIVIGSNPESKLGKTLASAADSDHWFYRIMARRARDSSGKLNARGPLRFGQFRSDVKGVPHIFNDDEFHDSMTEAFSSMYETEVPKGLAAITHRRRTLFRVVDRSHENYIQGLADEILRLHNDPIARAMAKANNPEEALAMISPGGAWHDYAERNLFRPDRSARPSKDVIAPQLIGSMSEAEIDSLRRFYVDSMYERLRGVSNGDPKIIQSIADGNINGVKLSNTSKPRYQAVLDEVKSQVDSGLFAGPEHVRIPLDGYAGRGPGIKGVGKGLSHVVDQTMFALMGRPSNFLSRSPAFRQFYWERVEELMPFADDAARAAILKHANDTSAPLPPAFVKHLESIPRTRSKVSLDEIDELSKGYALGETKNLLYDLSERGQLFDQLRLLFPFGEAYKEVMSRWAKIVWQNPKVLRRFGQGVREFREAGYFEKGPYGQEVFTIPGSEWLTDKLVGVPIPISGSVQGLNLAGNGLPGVGPAVSIPLAYILPNTPQWNNLREIIYPYGNPNTGQPVQDLVEAFTPSWLGHTLEAFQTPEGSREFASMLGYIMNYKASTGEYDLHGPNAEAEADRLLQDSTAATRIFAIIRGVGSATLPSAPIPRWQFVDPENGLAEIQAVREHYFKEAQKIGYDKAYENLIERYGADNFLLPQGFSASTSIFPRTRKQWDWINEHPEVRERYGLTYGLFTPRDAKGEFDITSYLLTEERGERDRLTPKQRVELANDRLAALIHDRTLADLPDSDEADRFMRKLDERLRHEFPGYEPTPDNLNITKRRMLELEQAARDPDLYKVQPRLITHLRKYLAVRRDVMDIADQAWGNINGYQRAKRARPLRDLLRKTARQLIRSEPSFRDLWQQVLSREIKDDTEGED